MNIGTVVVCMLSFQPGKVVDKWTEYCPLIHNLYYGDGGQRASESEVDFGGFIQTVSGSASGLGNPLTKRSGWLA